MAPGFESQSHRMEDIATTVMMADALDGSKVPVRYTEMKSEEGETLYCMEVWHSRSDGVYEWTRTEWQQVNKPP